MKALLRLILMLAVLYPNLVRSAPDRLNVLLIVSDDLNNSLGCFGNPTVKTPNIDRLASRGVRFDHAYVQCSLCNPSRVSFLSGLRPDATGVHDLVTPTRTYLKDYVFLPQYFRQSGYYSAGIGKIYHTGQGFEDPLSWDLEIREWGKTPQTNQIALYGEARGYRDSWEWMKLKIPDAETPDGTVVSNAVAALEQARSMGKQFFFGVGFRRPHRPYSAPAKYFDLYPPEKIVLPNEPADHVKAIPRAALTYDPSKPDMSPAKRREGIAAYYACVSFMDAQVGLLMEALERNHLWDKTVIVFIGDNGYHLGEHGGMWHKESNFEESAKVPLIIVAPGKRANAACTWPVELLDLYPTICQLAGLPAPKGLQGASLVPLLEEPERKWNRPAYTQIRRKEGFMGRSVRTERWRYIEWDDGKKGVQLYDEANDPREYVNLASDLQHADTVKELQRLLQRARASTPVAGQQRE
jgi:uncharacterized sulfatase